MRSTRILSLLAAAILAVPCTADTYDVPGDFDTIQAAIDACQDGDEIIVHPGLYREFIDYRGRSVTVRSEDPDSDISVQNTRILGSVAFQSGEGAGAALTGFTMLDSEPYYGSLRILDSSPTISRCWFLYGRADAYGGAVSCINSAAAFLDCEFRECEAVLGAAVAIQNSSGVSLTGCKFESGIAQLGGGLTVALSDDIAVSGCSFTANTADRGGGLYSSYSDVTITECSFLDGGGGLGAGLFAVGSEIMISASQFRDNRVSYDGKGGAIYCYESSLDVVASSLLENFGESGGGGAWLEASTVRMMDSLIARNSSDAWFVSGGVTGVNCDLLLLRCDITENRASSWGGDGGGVSITGGTSQIIDCTFDKNVATFGGGLIVNSSDTWILNCLFRLNDVSLPPTGGGGAIYVHSEGDSPVQIVNSTFVANLGYDSVIEGPDRVTLRGCVLYLNEPGTLWGGASASHCLVEGGSPGEGNLDADPLFIRDPDPGPDGWWGGGDDDPGDLRLRPRSPCIDAGDNTALPPDTFDLDQDGDTTEPIPLDLDGLPRVADDPGTPDIGIGGNGQTAMVDMGAFEFHGISCRPDVNDDGLVDTQDFILFLNLFVAEDRGAEFNRDGTIDTQDFIAFLNAWVTGC